MKDSSLWFLPDWWERKGETSFWEQQEDVACRTENNHFQAAESKRDVCSDPENNASNGNSLWHSCVNRTGGKDLLFQGYTSQQGRSVMKYFNLYYSSNLHFLCLKPYPSLIFQILIAMLLSVIFRHLYAFFYDRTQEIMGQVHPSLEPSPCMYYWVAWHYFTASLLVGPHIQTFCNMRQ